jgi:DNA-binding HxlR family transcriptional regulator
MRRRRSDCPVHFGLEAFGDQWSLLIIRDLMFKERTTYTDFLRAEEGIATNVLADRLVRLQQDGIIEHAPASYAGYRLTDRGADLHPVELLIIRWSAAHDPDTAADAAFVERVRTDRAGLEAELRQALTARGPS